MSNFSPERAESEGFGPGSLQRFRDLFSVLGRVYSTRLDVPVEIGDGTNVKRDKEFCVGLLENPVSHAWWPHIRGLGHRERTSIQGSLFLARKVLESPPDPRQAGKHAALLGSPAPKAESRYLEFVDREIDRLFKPGWDSDYRSHVYSHSPTSSSCLEYDRSEGGVRTWASQCGRDWFLDHCLGDAPRPDEYHARYLVVRTQGKNRGVTVASGYATTLGPLHRTLYDYLSQFEWLLRGEARGKKFKSFHRVKGEVFVSGDYESATDNLNLEVTERILSRILSHARQVPVTLRDYAMRSLRAKIWYETKDFSAVVDQQRGQLMGNYLSFPLLCLHNYLAFRYSISRDVPLRINGDDIVFRCRRSEYVRWRENVGSSGLVLSAGKTLVNRTIFSLNSAFFDAQSRRVREIPVCRLSMVCGEGPPQQADFAKYIRGWKGESRRLVGGFWLRCFRARIRALGRSVRGLGIRADPSQLHTAGLADREAFFSGSLCPLPESPLPPSPHDFSNPAEGKEWLFTTRPLLASPAEVKAWDLAHRTWCVEAAWKPSERAGCTARARRWNEWWNECRRTGFESAWRAWKVTSRRVKRMKFASTLGISLRSRVVPGFQPGKWVPRDEYPAYLCQRPGLGWT